MPETSKLADARELLRAGDRSRALSTLIEASPHEEDAARLADALERRAWRPPPGELVSERVSLQHDAHTVFLLRGAAEHLVGRKHLSARYESGEIDSLYDAYVTPAMLLGVERAHRVSADDLRVTATGLSEQDASARFEAAAAAADAELIFPYARLIGARREEPESAADGWTLTPRVETTLSHGERELRAWLARVASPWLSNGGLCFDPACSTGEALAVLSADGVRTVGQDLSEAMVARARDRLDEVHVADARLPAVTDGSVDVLLLRFLNSGVVTTADARALLARLRRVVKPGGRVVAFGHTPLLLDATDFIEAGLDVESCVARTADGSLAQAYVARAPS